MVYKPGQFLVTSSVLDSFSMGRRVAIAGRRSVCRREADPGVRRLGLSFGYVVQPMLKVVYYALRDVASHVAIGTECFDKHLYAFAIPNQSKIFTRPDSEGL